MVKLFIRSDEDVLDALVETVARCRLAVADALQRPSEMERQIDGLLDELADIQTERAEVTTIEDRLNWDRRKWGIQNRIAELVALMNDSTAIDTARRDRVEAENRLAAYVAREWVSR